MKIKIKAFVLLLVTSAFICSVAYASSRSISVSGVVRQPLNLSLEDLHQFQTVRVQLNEVLKDRSYRGAWYYRGVTLRTLLETAFIEKEESSLKKPLDLAILVRNREGKEVAGPTQVAPRASGIREGAGGDGAIRGRYPRSRRA